MFKLLLFKTVCALLWSRRRKKKKKNTNEESVFLSCRDSDKWEEGEKDREGGREMGGRGWRGGRKGETGKRWGGGERERERAYGVSKELGVLRPVNQCGYNLVFYAESTSTVVTWYFTPSPPARLYQGESIRKREREKDSNGEGRGEK